MKIGITGGCGFVGFNLACDLQQHEVVVFDSLVRRGSEINLKNLKGKAQFIHGDVRSARDVSALEGCDIILHCAAQPSATAGDKDPVADVDHNIIGVVNVLELCRRTGAGLIFWSTNKVYSGWRLNDIAAIESGSRWFWSQEPYATYGISEDFPIDGGGKSVYGVTKTAGDLLCQEYATAFAVKIWINRCSCLAGPNQWGKSDQGWISWLAKASVLDLPVVVEGWDGHQIRDILHIDDLSRLVQLQIARIGEANGTAFNVGGGPSRTLSLKEALDWFDPLLIQYRNTARRGDQRVYVSDIRKAADWFGWAPTKSVTETLESVREWTMSNRSEL